MFTSELPKLMSGLIYIAKRLIEQKIEPDMYKILKIMYFSDKISLSQYKQVVFGGYSKLPYGPVQERLYKKIKQTQLSNNNRHGFTVVDHTINPTIDPDMDEFSEFDIDSIERSIEENKHLTFEELKNKSHDSAWDHTVTGAQINVLDIAQAAGLNRDSIEYLKDVAESSQLIQK